MSSATKMGKFALIPQSKLDELVKFQFKTGRDSGLGAGMEPTPPVPGLPALAEEEEEEREEDKWDESDNEPRWIDVWVQL